MILDFFKNQERLASTIRDYHYRKPQADVGEVVYNGIENNLVTFIEAPTGIGKTLAYLIPAFTSGERIIISTKTKQLMNQLLYKDIYAVFNLFDRKHNIGSLKGRKNYFCRERYERLIKSNPAYYSDAIEWFDYTNSNSDIVEAPYSLFNNGVLDLMTADRNQCKYQKCHFYDDCPFYIKRDEANNADIVVTNHHLLLSDIAMTAKDIDQSVFTFPDHIIFDEAHSIIDIYPLLIGNNISLRSVVKFFDENKNIISFKDIGHIKNLYETVLACFPEDNRTTKLDYHYISEKVYKFMSESAFIVDTLESKYKDTKAEMKRIQLQYEEFQDYDEGISFGEKNGYTISLNNIPLSVSSRLPEDLSRYTTSATFISATLSSVQGFDYFIKETGFTEENSKSFIFDGVFDYKKNALTYVPTSADIGENTDNIIKDICKISNGSVLIVCNSIARMDYIAEFLLSLDLEYPVYTQNSVDISELKESKCIIIGCSTLREGIDLSEINLHCVILDKLPFEYPNDFYFKHKSAQIEQQFGNSFTNYSLPRAVLFFKQITGRLLRKEQDKGAWVILDERILTKFYGKHFLKTLNGAAITREYKQFQNFIQKIN